MTAHEPERRPAEIVAEHMAECTDAQAAIVVDGNADSVIANLLADGWTLKERVDLIAGKRIRFVSPPEGGTNTEIFRALRGDDHGW